MSKISELIFNNDKHYITSGYGYRTLNGKRSLHQGVDYGTDGIKKPQYAIEDGYVFSTGRATADGALYVWVIYPRIKKAFIHYHLDKHSVVATQDVHKGNIIGYTGKTGNATGIHLHLGVRDLSRLSDSQIKNISWGALRSCPYIDPEKIIYVPVSENPYTEPTEVINHKKHQYSAIKGNPNIGVKWVQWELVRLGYNIGIGASGEQNGIDGYFGKKTEQAVKEFQSWAKAKGLYDDEIDGNVYTKTKNAFKAT
ncbi:MAG: peptidoglycan DD-metalloendopeptidase family protein [Oscillospiraceae bacterium]